MNGYKTLYKIPVRAIRLLYKKGLCLLTYENDGNRIFSVPYKLKWLDGHKEAFEKADR